MKVVLRILAMTVIACLVGGLSCSLDRADTKMLNHLSGVNNTQCSLEMCSQFLVSNFHVFVFFGFIPIQEFVLYPIFRKYMLQINSRMKVIFGFFLLALHYLSLLIIDVVGHHFTHFSDRDNTCFLSEKSHHISLSYWWYCTRGIFRGLNLFYTISGAIEFIASQSPYSVKGLLIGFAYLICGLFVLFTTLLLLPVFLTVKNWHPVPYGCGVWFYLCASTCFHSGVYHCIKKGVQDEKER